MATVVTRKPTLYEDYDALSKRSVKLKELVPEHVEKNLRHDLREYQKEAIGRWMYYCDTDEAGAVSPNELLFHMATGSGKTLVMAALILDLYKRGKRNFIFFVNSTNIVEKTRDNFLDPGAPKYLFADNIVIDGKRVEIREVQNFTEANPDAINILLTTTHKLHGDLKNVREGSETFEDLAKRDLVLIGDEAHHNNGGLSKDEKEDNSTWESTIRAIKYSVLLEFTATIDMSDTDIFNKYVDRVIYRYDLREFRLDGFSKDVLIYAADIENDHMRRALQTIIISQYRKKVAGKHGVFLKPVVMFKSHKYVKQSKEDFENFNKMLAALTPDAITRERKQAKDILEKAFAFYDANGISDTDLCAELKEDFREERCLLVNGDSVTPEIQNAVNTLENHDNEYRAIFTVAMLQEGWDVLNLFDIVRLYQKRDGGGHGDTYKPGPTTISEAQLIGRGARYFPFTLPPKNDVSTKYIRKLDGDLENELRVLEQLHFHSQDESRYIAEIRQTLDKTGITDYKNTVERTLRLKESFKSTRTYTEGVVWMNERIDPQASGNTTLIKTLQIPSLVEINLPTGIGRTINVFDPSTNSESATKETVRICIGSKKEIPLNVIRAAMNSNPAFYFDNLKQFLFHSRDAFVKKLESIDIDVTGEKSEVHDLNAEQKLFIAKRVLVDIEEEITTATKPYGTEKFKAHKIKDIFREEIVRKYTLDNDENSEGRPQATSPKYGIDLSEEAWYAYNENYGTSEEKSLVKAIKTLMKDLSEKWEDIYLLRNERGAVKLYNFTNGKATEPDFLLFANSKGKGVTSWQIFIEPKGGHLIAGDKWKEDLYKEITRRNGLSRRILCDDPNFQIIGMPFYNEASTRTEFEEELKAL